MKGRCLSKTPIKDLLVDGNIINNSSVVVKRDIKVKVGDINESPSVIAAEDYELWLRISEISNKLYYIPAVLGEYYIGCENISNKNMSVCAENASKRFVEHLDNNELVKYKARIKYLNGRYMYLDRNYIEARYELMEVVKSGKFMLKIKSIYMICVMLFLSAFK